MAIEKCDKELHAVPVFLTISTLDGIDFLLNALSIGEHAQSDLSTSDHCNPWQIP